MLFANGALFLASAVPGIAGGIWGVVFGTSRLLWMARDNEERRALRRLQWTGIVTVIVFTLGAPASFVLTRSRAVFVASFLAFFTRRGSVAGCLARTSAAASRRQRSR